MTRSTPTAQEAEMTHETLTDEAMQNLIEIVEGIKGSRQHGFWRDRDGTRLKDTPEWVAFYNAVRDMQPAPAAEDLRAENERLREAYHRLEQQWAAVCQITAMELREEADRAALRDAQGGTDGN